jgi:L-glyceraldehyde 3-phosphate reductase
MSWQPAPDRHERMAYARSGRSGLLLPRIALGLWQNFGETAPAAVARAMIRRAIDLGVTHLDLANNYGPPPGAAESLFGEMLAGELRPWRDELVISTKAGYRMWPGPYGEWGSRKHLLASLDQSLRRMRLDYVDIFYSHRFDPETPLEETMGALDQAVRAGKALYVGISSYPAEQTRTAARILKELGTPCLIHQPRYSILDRWIEPELLDVLALEGIGCIVFSPLAQGLLTGRYLAGVPEGSRAARDLTLRREMLTPDLLRRLQGLDAIARERGQTLAQLALTWVLRDPRVTSALIGASRVEQVEECVRALDSPPLSPEELARIDALTLVDHRDLWSTLARR